MAGSILLLVIMLHVIRGSGLVPVIIWNVLVDLLIHDDLLLLGSAITDGAISLFWRDPHMAYSC